MCTGPPGYRLVLPLVLHIAGTFSLVCVFLWQLQITRQIKTKYAAHVTWNSVVKYTSGWHIYLRLFQVCAQFSWKDPPFKRFIFLAWAEVVYQRSSSLIWNLQAVLFEEDNKLNTEALVCKWLSQFVKEPSKSLHSNLRYNTVSQTQKRAPFSSLLADASPWKPLQ